MKVEIYFKNSGVHARLSKVKSTALCHDSRVYTVKTKNEKFTYFLENIIYIVETEDNNEQKS